jgi:hypothetical protein
VAQHSGTLAGPGDTAGQRALVYGRHDRIRARALYHEVQHGPAAFYRRLGFHPTGEQNHGETVAERTLVGP